MFPNAIAEQYLPPHSADSYWRVIDPDSDVVLAIIDPDGAIYDPTEVVEKIAVALRED